MRDAAPRTVTVKSIKGLPLNERFYCRFLVRFYSGVYCVLWAHGAVRNAASIRELKTKREFVKPAERYEN
jgi:hypothetical protein